MSPDQGLTGNDNASLKALLESSRGQTDWNAREKTTTADQMSTNANTARREGLLDEEFGEFEGSDELHESMPFTVGDLAERGHVLGRTPTGDAARVTSTLQDEYTTVQRASRGGQATTAGVDTHEKEDHTVHSRFSIKRYRGFFDVNTSDVASRVCRSLLFWNNDFLDHLHDNPDLYGPFWIASTLVFVSAAAANTAGYIAHHQESSSEYWYYDVDKVGGSMAIFYGYIGIIGMITWAVIKYFKGSASLATVWCIYGYALSIFVPISIACVVPSNAARWVLVMTATAMSAAFLLRSIKVCLLNSELEGGKGVPILGLVAACHGALGLALKWVFFNY